MGCEEKRALLARRAVMRGYGDYKHSRSVDLNEAVYNQLSMTLIIIHKFSPSKSALMSTPLTSRPKFHRMTPLTIPTPLMFRYRSGIQPFPTRSAFEACFVSKDSTGCENLFGVVLMEGE